MDFCEYMIRSRGKLSRVAAGAAISVSPRTIEAWEYGRCKPGPEHVAAMARVYRDPDLRLYYCNHVCAIGQIYGYRVLNRVDIDLMAVLAKLEDELQEAIDAVRAMRRLSLNKRLREDYSDGELADLETHYQELLDVAHVVQVTQRTLDQEVLDIAKMIRRHNQKCADRGYYVPERKNALAGAL